MKKSILLLICFSVMISSAAWKLNGIQKLFAFIISTIIAIIALIIAIKNEKGAQDD